MSNQEDLLDFFAGLAMKHFMETTTKEEAEILGVELDELIAARSYALSEAFIKEKKERGE